MTTELQRTGTLQKRSIGLYDRYISYIDASPKTIETYSKALKQFKSWIDANHITEPTRDDVISYREYLKADHKPATVQTYIVVVRQFFQWLECEGLYKNVASHVKGAKVNKEHKKDYLTASQIKSIMQTMDHDSVQGKRDYALFVTMTTCGIRDIEASRANIGDMRTAGASTVLYLQGKGREDKAEFVKIPAETETIIRDYLKARGTAGTDEPLFASVAHRNAGGRMTTRSISRIIKSTLRAAGYDSDRLTAHSLRHTAVTLSLLAGNSLQETQQFARHQNIATTQIYAHNLDCMANKCSNSVAAAIF